MDLQRLQNEVPAPLPVLLHDGPGAGGTLAESAAHEAELRKAPTQLAPAATSPALSQRFTQRLPDCVAPGCLGAGDALAQDTAHWALLCEAPGELAPPSAAGCLSLLISALAMLLSRGSRTHPSQALAALSVH